MATTLVDLVKIYSTSAGTTAFVLGSAVSGFRGVDALGDGLTYSYTVQQGDAFEYGYGVYDATAGTLTRSPLDSSLDGATVPFNVNAQIAFVLLAEDVGGGGGGGAVINDNLISTNFVWSSSKTNVTIAASAATIAASVSALAVSTTNALATKEPTIAPGNAGDYWAGNKAWLSTANLPISTATAAALALKAPLASPTFTGVARAATTSDEVATARQVIVCPTEVLTLPPVNAFQPNGPTLPPMAYYLATDDRAQRLCMRYSNDSKGFSDYIGHSRGSAIGTYAPLVFGDKVYTLAFYGGSVGPGSDAGMGHTGSIHVFISGTPRTVAPVTELPSGMYLKTCTGSQTEGDRTFIAADHTQRVEFPGPNSIPTTLGTDLPAIVHIGAGGTAPNSAPIKFTTASLMTTPEPFALEVDAAGLLYTTNAAAVRARIIAAEEGTPTLGAPGTGMGSSPGAIVLVDGPDCGKISFTTGTSPVLAGDVVTITYPHAFPTDSVVTFSAMNGVTAAGIRTIQITSNASGFTITNAFGAFVAATTYAIQFTYRGW